MDNFLTQVNHFYLIVFTDAEGELLLSPYAAANPQRIYVVLKPLYEFQGWAYRDFWQRNHARNNLLNNRTSWELNMIWCEKVHLVAEARAFGGFPETEFYGWCDIGYFRGRPGEDLPKTDLTNFAHPDRVREKISTNKIHYALVVNDTTYLNNLFQTVRRRGPNGLPQIPPNQVSIAGGFFIGHRDIIPAWQSYFANRLAEYVAADALVKDDQIVVVDCVFSRPHLFELHQEFQPPLDPWFLFQRVLTPLPPST